MNQNLRVNKTNFLVKGFALGLALKQVKGNSEIAYSLFLFLRFVVCLFRCCCYLLLRPEVHRMWLQLSWKVSAPGPLAVQEARPAWTAWDCYDKEHNEPVWGEFPACFERQLSSVCCHTFAPLVPAIHLRLRSFVINVEARQKKPAEPGGNVNHMPLTATLARHFFPAIHVRLHSFVINTRTIVNHLPLSGSEFGSS